MKRAPWLALLALAGCDAVEPWVSERPTAPPFAPIACVEVAECALFDELTVGNPGGGISSPEPRCADGLVARSLAVAGDTRIDAASLACTDVTIAIEDGDTPLVLTVEGDALAAVHLRVRSTSRPVELRLEARVVEDAIVEGDGPISLTATGAGFERSRLEVRASRAVTTPVLRIEGGAHQDLAIALPIGALRLDDAEVERAHLDVEQLASRRGELVASTVRAELADLIAVELADTTLEVLELAAGGGDWRSVELARCDALLLSRVQLESSRLAACEGPVWLEEVQAERSAFAGDVHGTDGYYLECAFAGESVELGSRIHRSAFCGVARIDARQLICVRCEPDAPPDVCALVEGDTALCPGVCHATCEDGALWFGGQACRAPDA